MKIVEVLWDDSSTASGSWQSRADIEGPFHSNPCLCATVGILIKRDRKQITVATSVGGGNDSIGGAWRIPAGMVKSYRVLGTVKKLPK